MKLNNRGFAVAGIIYSLLVLFLIIIMLVLGILSNRKIQLNSLKNKALEQVNNDSQNDNSYFEYVLNRNNVLDYGDTLQLGTQKFLVLFVNSNNVDLITFNPINVSDYTTRKDRRQTVNGEKNVIFSDSATHGTNYSSYDGSIVKLLVDDYKNTLEKMGVSIISASLISHDQLNTLGCVSNPSTCGDFLFKVPSWTSTSVDDTNLYSIDVNNIIESASYNSELSIRPIIRISKASIK